ncbi:MAG: DUF4249 domain-containing protein [Bacteroidota bacterium]
MKNISIFILAIFAFSCETIVTDSLVINDSEPLLVIEGGIERYVDSTDVIQSIKLTTTNNFLSNAPNPVVDDAEVNITDSDRTYSLIYQGNGVYSTGDLQPQIGETYTLEIIWNGAIYTASDLLNEVPRIDSIYTEFEEESLFTDEGYFLKLNTIDPVGIANFYHYRVYRNNEFITVPDPGNSRTLRQEDEFFDGQLREGVEPNEEVIYEVGDLAMVDQMGISEAYFDFLFQVYNQTGQDGGFVGNPPPASIRGNINSTSRALGFFYAADIHRRSIQVR